MPDRYEELYRSFRWDVPARYNMARAVCGNWAVDRSRFALYWEDESGATAAYSFWDIQQAANRLSNALAALGVKRNDRVAIILPQRPETAIAYVAVFQMGAIASNTAWSTPRPRSRSSRRRRSATWRPCATGSRICAT
jgi:acetyl-CoA synthetase